MRPHQLLFIASLFTTLYAGAGCADTSDVTHNGMGVSSVELTPDKATLTKGSTLQFSAMVRYADGTSADVTDDPDTVWNTSDASIATVSRAGMVAAISEGLVDISANFKGEKANEHFAVTP